MPWWSRTLLHLLVDEYRNRCHDNVTQCDGQHHLPAEPHELIVSQPWQRGPEPEEEEQEGVRLDRKPHRVLDPRQGRKTDERHNRSRVRCVPTAEKQCGGYTGHQHHIGVLCEEKEGESEPAVFSEEAG